MASLDRCVRKFDRLVILKTISPITGTLFDGDLCDTFLPLVFELDSVTLFKLVSLPWKAPLSTPDSQLEAGR